MFPRYEYVSYLNLETIGKCPLQKKKKKSSILLRFPN